MVKKLQLTMTPELLCIEGIGLRKQQSQRRMNILLQSRINSFTSTLEAHVLPRIISSQPSQAIDTATWSIPNNIQLADPHFNHPESIELLIGAELYYSLLSVGQIKLGDDLPILQNTVFGWTAAGKTYGSGKVEVASCGICNEEELDQQIEKFWKLEEPSASKNNFTTSEERCENHFNSSTRRDCDGRFVVRLSFINEPGALGESKGIAFQRLLAPERRLSRHLELRDQYIQFMNEYINLGHMKEVNFNEIQHHPHYFMPHHSVIKPNSSSTKLRVVFDASAKTASNISLNDISRPTIQDDVFSILLRFRMPRFVFTADIEKMYRQVRVDEADQKYQLIWWRKDPNQKVKCFQLCTVTYGTTCAPYLATKCLQKLAFKETENHPLGAAVLPRDFYVDDVLTGSDSLATTLEMQLQLNQILASAGFKLRKWYANHPQLLEGIPESDQELQLDFSNKSEDNIKAIGLTWLPKSDEFVIKTAWNERERLPNAQPYPTLPISLTR